MSQITRPDQDISTGSWSNAPIYPQLSGTQAGGSGIKSAAGTPGDTFEVGLAPLAGTCCAPATLSVSLRKNEASSLLTTVALLQDKIVIAGQEVEPSQSFANVDLTLASDQVCKIKDPADVSVRVIAGPPQVGCCPGVGIPALLMATVHNVVNCDVLEGITVRLVWDGVQWHGETSCCDMRVWFSLTCSASNFILIGHRGNDTGCTVSFNDDPRPATSCSPLMITFAIDETGITNVCPCCPDTLVSFDVDITE